MMIVIRVDHLTQDEAEEACMELSEMLDAEVFLGLEDAKGWKIPTLEDWQQ